MRGLVLVASLVFAACASDAPMGPQGPAGEKGESGIVGPAGPAGPQGPAGASAISVGVLPQGAACPAGGVAIGQADGGQFALCNGTQGAPGAVGPAGAAGAQGPKGDPAPSLTVWDINDAEIGPAVGYGAYDFSGVFVSSAGCIGNINYTTNMVEAIDTDIRYTGANCSGTAVIVPQGNVYFPLGCLKGADGLFYKVQQPVTRQMINTASKRSAFSTSDGGVTILCTAETGSFSASPVVQMQFTPPTGPFRFGKR